MKKSHLFSGPIGWTFWYLLVLGVFVTACTSTGPGRLFQSLSPHEQYARSLADARLERTALGADWLAAGEKALRDSLTITAPYRESGYFSAGKPFAVGYRISGRRGDKFIVRIDVQGRQPVQMFVDVFELDEQRRNRSDRLTSAKIDSAVTTLQFDWEVRRDRVHLIRVQPELLRSGRYTLSITREPILSFPVSGRDSRSISSFFGAPRDAGRRSHEGIDIFAPRGTPVVASSEGVISGVGTNNLGGNVVWLSDARRSHTLYYAHLDSWAVNEGQRVVTGDTLGFVGNTGNARTTSPHLHFGVYRFGGGAVDPLPYVRLGTGPARQSLLPAETLGDSLRISATRGLLRQSPRSESAILRELPRSSPLLVLGGTANWLRVELPDGATGYVSAETAEPIRRTLRRLPLPNGADIRETADGRSAVVKLLSPGSVVDVLGVVGSFQLIRSQEGVTGWVRRETTP